MGYESKITVCRVWDRGKHGIYNEVLVSLDMGKVYEEGWIELYDTPCEGDVCIGLPEDYYVGEDGEIEQRYTQKDPYGEPPMQASPAAVLSWCKEHYKSADNKMMIGFLKDILARLIKDKVFDYKVIHTGY